MSEIYTPNDLIRYIYKETSTAETANIQHFIQHNAQAKEEYESLMETLDVLPDVSLNANPTSIQLILEYAHKQAPELI